jgi:hypothetical protein
MKTMKKQTRVAIYQEGKVVSQYTINTFAIVGAGKWADPLLMLTLYEV